MAHEGGNSNVGFPKTYESGDQRRYSASEVSAVGATHAVNAAGHKDQTKIVNQLYDEDTQGRINDRHKHEPGYSAIMHGNEPSRGAEIDASIAQEEAELLEKKKNKTDSISSKK